MIAASRIFGDQVGSTAPVFLAFLAVHVLAGLTAVAAGAVAALACKGSSRHIRAGRLYYRAITVVFATATALAIMRWRQDYYLLIIGAVAFSAAVAGVQHRRRRRPGDTGHGFARRFRSQLRMKPIAPLRPANLMRASFDRTRPRPAARPLTLGATSLSSMLLVLSP